jgi:type II restriction/modification system DNA methylase subunit YeeA
MLDLWQEARIFAADHGLPTVLPEMVHPSQLYGLELNTYAHELASVVVWIGYLQWLQEHGMGVPTEPILRKLDNIQHRDAILAHDSEGRPVEAAWPEADFIIGNPPFLGGSKMRSELGDDYVTALKTVYEGRIPGGADLVTYWFEKARGQIATANANRAGLIATQAIRAGLNRTVLDRINRDGSVFMAWQDRPWVLDGAAIRVSIVGFDNGTERSRSLNGIGAATIHADLTGEASVLSAKRLQENLGLGFKGQEKNGDFDLSPDVALTMMQAPLNPNGRPNSDVIRPWVNGTDLARRPRGMFIIDFGTDLSESEAALYEAPFEYIRQNVYPKRMENNRDSYREKWWIHGEPRPAFRHKVANISRYIVTPRVAKYRLFAWAARAVVPDSRLYAITRDDDYFFGILHSRLHEVWSIATCSWHGVGNDPTYNAATCFETFPFPWAPGKESQDDPLVQAIAQAASELMTKRDAWLNPADATAEELNKRTLTNLYNKRPEWLADAHRKLDEAVFAAYGWPSTLTDAEILERLLALNHQRAAAG